MVYCNVICTGLPLRLFSTLVFFWKRHVILRDSIYLLGRSLLFEKILSALYKLERGRFVEEL